MSEALAPGDNGNAATTAPRFVIAESAARRIAEIAKAEGRESVMLRVSVSGGGCSGFQYGFDFADEVNDDDFLFERDGAKVVIDEISLDLLAGAELDFVEDLMGAYFRLNNPNATSSCGCGSSFAI